MKKVEIGKYHGALHQGNLGKIAKHYFKICEKENKTPYLDDEYYLEGIMQERPDTSSLNTQFNMLKRM